MNRSLTVLTLIVISYACTFAHADTQPFSVSLVGEIIVGQGLEPVIEQRGPRVLFEGIQELLHQTDLAAGTLGASLGSAGERRSGVEHAFRAPAALARGLAYSGIRHVSLASPHIMDYGPESLDETLRLLEWYGVSGFGAGLTIKQARQPLIEEIRREGKQKDKIRIGLVAYYHGGQFSNSYADDSSPGVVPAAWSVLEKDIPAAAAEVDLLIVFIHWGVDPQQTVSSRQQLFAHRLVELGADVVAGYRSHIWQGMEFYQGKPIFYSLSDLFFDTYSRQYSRTVIPQLFYEGHQLRRVRLTPVWLEPSETPYQPIVLTGEEANQTLQEYQRLSPGVSLQREDTEDYAEVTIEM